MPLLKSAGDLFAGGKTPCPLPGVNVTTRRNLFLKGILGFAFAVTTIFSGATAANQPQTSTPADRKDLVSAVKVLEKKLGFRRTKNFHKESKESDAGYRCYYTGKLELPESYSGLQLVAGTEAGGSIP